MSYGDVRSLPVPYRRWFLDRLTREFEEQQERAKKIQGKNTTGPREIPIDDIMKDVQSSVFKKF